IGLRLWQLQVAQYQTLASEATEQRMLYRNIAAKRGEIYATERTADGSERRVALAVNRKAYNVYADTRSVQNAERTATLLSDLIGLPATDLVTSLSKPNDPYVLLKRRVLEDTAEEIRKLALPGIGLEETVERFYPNNTIGSHVVGFVTYGDQGLHGQYGIEGRLDKLLAGTSGTIRSERDAQGIWIALADRQLSPVVNGSTMVLTIDWTIQFTACRALDEWVAKHGADGGSVVVVNPKTGAILAMCGTPDYNPNTYNETQHLSMFNNPATFLDYEPGSIFKPITMAAALDQQKVTPDTTYTDEGFVRFGANVIKNSDGQAHGVQTMTSVLNQSLNTGAIFVMRTIGASVFRKYVEDFGFGGTTGVELSQEAAGNIKPLYQKNEIYSATASFGQGLTVTPLQMVMAYAAIANGGTLVQPYLVREIDHPDGTREIPQPVTIRRVMAERTATLLSGMLVSVVEHGHGKRAGVPGYFIAGKTGTAQVPSKNASGYEPGVTIGSFVGFGPVEDPRFAMIIRIDRPRDVQFAESSAAPLFGEIAKAILQYYEVAPRANTPATHPSKP
ncbi:hypothetical protein A3C17_01820, partial [Candidatus Uhrbacteria bacterium RIFCSPHIGHO2_02_FULL_53_13]